jgi:GT2 family glycosyltransferase
MHKLDLTISIIVLHTNHFSDQKNYINKALFSLARAVKKNQRFNVHIVLHANNFPNNISYRRSFEDFVLRFFPNSTKIFFSGENLGFCQSHNHALSFAQKKYGSQWYMILNDDARVAEDFFMELEDILQHSSAAAISGIVYNDDRTIQSMGMEYFPSGICLLNTDIEKSESFNLFCGVMSIFPKWFIHQEFRRNGYIFNPIFFIYCEDLELSLRILKNNHSIYIFDRLKLVHKGSVSTRTIGDLQAFYCLRNWIFVIIVMWQLKEVLKNFNKIIRGQLYLLRWLYRHKALHLGLHIALDIIKKLPLLLNTRKRYKTNLKNFSKPILFSDSAFIGIPD